MNLQTIDISVCFRAIKLKNAPTHTPLVQRVNVLFFSFLDLKKELLFLHFAFLPILKNSFFILTLQYFHIFVLCVIFLFFIFELFYIFRNFLCFDIIRAPKVRKGSPKESKGAAGWQKVSYWNFLIKKIP